MNSDRELGRGRIFGPCRGFDCSLASCWASHRCKVVQRQFAADHELRVVVTKSLSNRIDARLLSVGRRLEARLSNRHM